MRHKQCMTWNMGSNSEKREKWKMHTVTWNIARKLKNVENETQTLFNLEYGEKHSKMWKMRNAHCRTWKMARNSEKREKWEMYTIGSGLWRKNWKTWKIRPTHCMTCNMARKLQSVENETKTLFHLEYTHYMTWNMGRITEKHEKWEIHTVGPEISSENWNQTILERKYGEK